MKKLFDHKDARQLFSYVVVGGSAALVEWFMYWISDHYGTLYLISTVIAFIVATFVNWIMGRLLTFRNAESKKRGMLWEIIEVYMASLVGLFLNLGIMAFFVSGLGWNGMISKIISTGIVFIWNFLIRKHFIYKSIAQ